MRCLWYSYTYLVFLNMHLSHKIHFKLNWIELQYVDTNIFNIRKYAMKGTKWAINSTQILWLYSCFLLISFAVVVVAVIFFSHLNGLFPVILFNNVTVENDLGVINIYLSKRNSVNSKITPRNLMCSLLKMIEKSSDIRKNNNFIWK